jgi:hypothetical protein
MRQVKLNETMSASTEVNHFSNANRGFYIVCGVESASHLATNIDLSLPRIVIHDVMKRFCDPKLSHEEAEQLFRRFIAQLDYLKKRAVVIGFLNEEKVPAERRHLVMQLLGAARHVVTPAVVSVKNPVRVVKKRNPFMRYVRWAKEWSRVRGDIEGNDTPLSPCSI